MMQPEAILVRQQPQLPARAGLQPQEWPTQYPDHPVASYLAQLSTPKAMIGQLRKLRRAASLLSDGRADVLTYPWQQLSAIDVDRLRVYLTTHYAPAYGRAILSGVKGTHQQCARLGLCDASRAAMVWWGTKPIRGKSRPPGRLVPLEAAHHLVQTCTADGVPTRGWRDAALLALVYGGGLRLAEALGVEVQHLDLDRGTGWVTVTRGKGGKAREVPLLPGWSAVLAKWLEVRATYMHSTTGPVLVPVTRGGRAVQRQLAEASVGSILARVAESAGVPAIRAHDCRRSYCTHLLQAGADLMAVADLMGHSNVDTTRQYDYRGAEAMQQAVLQVPALEVQAA